MRAGGARGDGAPGTGAGVAGAAWTGRWVRDRGHTRRGRGGRRRRGGVWLGNGGWGDRVFFFTVEQGFNQAHQLFICRKRFRLICLSRALLPNMQIPD
jgi:hypothetical protein